MEQVGWGLEESELLWGAFEAAVAELTTTDDTMQARERFIGARLYGEAQRAVRARDLSLRVSALPFQRDRRSARGVRFSALKCARVDGDATS